MPPTAGGGLLCIGVGKGSMCSSGLTNGSLCFPVVLSCTGDKVTNPIWIDAARLPYVSADTSIAQGPYGGYMVQSIGNWVVAAPLVRGCRPLHAWHSAGGRQKSGHRRAWFAFAFHSRAAAARLEQQPANPPSARSLCAGIPQAIADKTPYRYDENTPIRKQIFAFAEVADRGLTIGTCLANSGVLSNFNHLVGVLCNHY